jgi:hypothetical protein
MNKVHVADGSDDKGFEGRGGKALDDTGCEEFFVGVCSLTDCGADNGE